MIKLPSPMTLGQIAGVIDGQVHGSSDLQIDSVATSPLSAGESDLAFVFDKQLLKQVDKCRAKAIVVPKGTQLDRPAIFVRRPNFAIYKILSAFPVKRYWPDKGVHPTAVIDPSAQVGADVAIGPFVVIG